MPKKYRYIILIPIFLTYNLNTFAQDTSSIKQYKSYDETNWDINLFRAINSNRSNFKDGTFTLIDKSVFPLALLYPSIMFSWARIKDNYYDENTTILTGLSELTSLSISTGLKYIIKRPRPYKTLKNVYVSKKSPADEWSFPSSHTSTVFSIAMINLLRYPDYPQLYIPIYAYAFLAAYARPYLGMHYPSDLLGGIIIGTSSSLLVYALRKDIIKIKDDIFNEKNRNDSGSITGKNIYIFGTALILSSFIAEVIFPYSNMQFLLTKQNSGSEITTLKLSCNF